MKQIIMQESTQSGSNILFANAPESRYFGDNGKMVYIISNKPGSLMRIIRLPGFSHCSYFPF